MNPLRQNYKHTKAVEAFFSLRPKYVHSVVVFIGDAEFKTSLPVNVTHRRGLCPYIQSKREFLLETDHIREIAQKLNAFKAGTLKEKPVLSVVGDEPQCPKCGKRMIMRVARNGRNAGGKFWGCPQFPRCRGVRQL